MSDTLTTKQQAFLEAYLACWNATEAARRAGYAFPNKRGPELVVNSGIREAIKARLTEKAMSADEVLARLGDQARADMRDFLITTDNGVPSGFNLGPGKPLHLVKKVAITKAGISFELYDAQAALALLAKHHGLLQDIDWPKVPEALIKALEEGLSATDVRRHTTAESQE